MNRNCLAVAASMDYIENQERKRIMDTIADNKDMDFMNELATKQFIDDEGPDENVRYRVAAGITDFFADAFDVDVERRNWGRCGTPQERANAIGCLDSIINKERANSIESPDVFDDDDDDDFDDDDDDDFPTQDEFGIARLFAQNEFKVARLFELPNNVVEPMDRVLSILKENLNGLQGPDRKTYREYMSDIIMRYCYLAFPKQDAKAVESLDDDDLIRILTLLLNSAYDYFTVVTPIMDRLEQLEKIGIRYMIDEPEDLLAPDVVLPIKSIECPRFNFYFALMTRPDGLGIHEAAAQLPSLNEKVSGIIRSDDFIGSEEGDDFFTWSVLDHDWDSIELPLANQRTESSYAAVLALEDREVKPDRVRKLIELFFPSKAEDREFDDMNRQIHAGPAKADDNELDSIQDIVKNAAFNHGDIDLLKAWEWLKDLVMHLATEINKNEDNEEELGYHAVDDEFYYRVSISRELLMNVLDHYNEGLPWSFIIETAKSYKNDSHPISAGFISYSYNSYAYREFHHVTCKDYFIYLYD